MDVRRYHVTLEGVSPLLLHADNLDWRARLERWQSQPENKKISRAGDDRTPAWRWLGYTYHNDVVLGVPADNLMTACREGGAKVPVPGKRNQTYKRQSQSGLVVDELLWPIRGPKGHVPWSDVAPLLEAPAFDEHVERVKDLGFELFVKSVRVGQSKHIRVRPRFDTWSTEGTVSVFDDSITTEVLQQIFDMAGMYCGLCDWRPSSPSKPGPWGRFNATIEVAS